MIKIEEKDIHNKVAHLTEITQKDFELIKQYKDLKGLDFSNSYFNGVKFDSKIENCNFANSKFYDCEFVAENIKECNFTNCDIDAEFRLGIIENCNFSNTRIEGSAYYSKFLSNDFAEGKLQRFRMSGETEFRSNSLRGTEFDTVFFGQNVVAAENHFLDSIRVELSGLPDSLPEYRQHQMKALNGEKPDYGEKLTSLRSTMAKQRANRYLKEFAEQHKKDIANLKGVKKTIVINAFAGAGAGKTTACHMIVAGLKKRGYVAEYVPEYAKDLVWDNKLEMLDGKEHNQFEILKEQLHRMDNKIGKVDFLVTDSPILLNQIYNQELTDYYKEMLTSIHSDYSNFNLFVNRNMEEFQQEGRIHNLTESLEKDQEIKDMLLEYGLEYQEYTHETMENVVDRVLAGIQGEVIKETVAVEKKMDSKAIDEYFETGAVVDNESYQFFKERLNVRKVTEDYLQISDEVMEPNVITGEPEVIKPLNPSTQRAEPVYRTFVTESDGTHRYIGYCFAGDRIQYGEKYGEWKKEMEEKEFMERPKNARIVAIETSEDVAEPNIGFETRNFPNGKQDIMYRLVTINESGGFTAIPKKDFFFMQDTELYNYIGQHKGELSLVSYYDLEHLAEEKEFGVDIEERVEKEDFSLKQCNYEQLSDVEKRIKYMEMHGIEKEKYPQNEMLKFDERLYEESQNKILFEAQKDFLTVEQFNLLANPELNSFQMQEIRLAFFEGLTTEQVGQFATKDMESWKMNLATRGIKEGIESEKVIQILNNENAHNWLAGKDLIEEELEKLRSTPQKTWETIFPFQDSESLGREEMKTLKEAKEINYSKPETVVSWEDIDERWKDLQRNADTYTPDEYDETRREIEALETVLEDQDAEFIETIEDVKVSEKIEAKPIGTVEKNGEVTEFFSEKEGLERYKEALENGQWQLKINEPEKHLLLQYKAEQYFYENRQQPFYTLESFCKDHCNLPLYEDKLLKVRDVVKEIGDRLTEFGDSALEIKGDSEKQITVNPEPVAPPLTEKQVQDILEIIKESAPHREVRELQDIARYISSIERQLREVSEQLDFAKAQLTSLGSKNPEVSKLLDDTEVLKKHTFSLQEKLREIKQDFSDILKNVSESIKQTGQTGLNKLMEHFKIEEKLENFQSGLSKLTADINEKQIKFERIGYELGQAGAHLQNVDKVVNGKVALEPSQNAGIALGNNLASPLKKIKETLNSLNEKTGKVLGKVKKLKTQAAENQKNKEAKKEEKSKQKNQKKEKRKKAIQKRRMMNLER